MLAKSRQWMLPALLLLLPLLLVGTGPLAPPAYPLLRLAQNMVAGRGAFFDAAVGGITPAWPAPLPTLLHALLAVGGAPVLAATRLLGAVGWGLAAVSAHLFYRRRPFTGYLFPLFLLLYPLVPLTAGTGLGWALAWLHLALLAARREAWGRHTLFTLLLLLTEFTPATLALAALLWGRQTAARGRPHPAGTLLLLAPVTLWGAWLFSQAGWPGPGSAPVVTPAPVHDLWPAADLFWLAAPLLVAGIGALLARARTARAAPGAERVPWLPLLVAAWWGVSLAWGLFSATALTGYLVLLLATLGVGWLADRPSLQAVPVPLWTVVAILLLLPPVLLPVLQPAPAGAPDAAALATWLQTNAVEPGPLVGPAEVAYIAGYPQHPLSARPLTPETAPAFAADLLAALPPYVVTGDDLAWQLVAGLDGFERRYQPVLGQTPGPALWELVRAPSGERRPLVAQSAQGVRLEGYRYEPERIAPGEAVSVTLYLAATEPLSRTFQTVVQLVSPVDGSAIAQRDEPTPRSLPLDWWEPEQLIAETYVLTTTDQAQIGAYDLNVYLHSYGHEQMWPLYLQDAPEPVDKLWLGRAAVPGPAPAVTQRLNAIFGEQIILHGVTTPPSATPGEEIAVTLSWGALRPPDDDYVAFVHLLWEDGSLIVGNDAEPLGGRFPTGALRPGDRIGEQRTLSLPPDLPPGRYRMQVGLYTPETVTRLPVILADSGEIPPERTVTLGWLEVTQ